MQETFAKQYKTESLSRVLYDLQPESLKFLPNHLLMRAIELMEKSTISSKSGADKIISVLQESHFEDACRVLKKMFATDSLEKAGESFVKKFVFSESGKTGATFEGEEYFLAWYTPKKAEKSSASELLSKNSNESLIANKLIEVLSWNFSAKTAQKMIEKIGKTMVQEKMEKMNATTDLFSQACHANNRLMLWNQNAVFCQHGDVARAAASNDCCSGLLRCLNRNFEEFERHKIACDNYVPHHAQLTFVLKQESCGAFPIYVANNVGKKSLDFLEGPIFFSKTEPPFEKKTGNLLLDLEHYVSYLKFTTKYNFARYVTLRDHYSQHCLCSLRENSENSEARKTSVFTKMGIWDDWMIHFTKYDYGKKGTAVNLELLYRSQEFFQNAFQISNLNQSALYGKFARSVDSEVKKKLLSKYFYDSGKIACRPFNSDALFHKVLVGTNNVLHGSPNNVTNLFSYEAYFFKIMLDLGFRPVEEDFYHPCLDAEFRKDLKSSKHKTFCKNMSRIAMIAGGTYCFEKINTDAQQRVFSDDDANEKNLKCFAIFTPSEYRVVPKLGLPTSAGQCGAGTIESVLQSQLCLFGKNYWSTKESKNFARPLGRESTVVPFDGKIGFVAPWCNVFTHGKINAHPMDLWWENKWARVWSVLYDACCLPGDLLSRKSASSNRAEFIKLLKKCGITFTSDYLPCSPREPIFPSKLHDVSYALESTPGIFAEELQIGETVDRAPSCSLHCFYRNALTSQNPLSSEPTAMTFQSLKIEADSKKHPVFSAYKSQNEAAILSESLSKRLGPNFYKTSTRKTYFGAFKKVELALSDPGASMTDLWTTEDTSDFLQFAQKSNIFSGITTQQNTDFQNYVSESKGFSSTEKVARIFLKVTKIKIASEETRFLFRKLLLFVLDMYSHAEHNSVEISKINDVANKARNSGVAKKDKIDGELESSGEKLCFLENLANIDKNWFCEDCQNYEKLAPDEAKGVFHSKISKIELPFIEREDFLEKIAENKSSTVLREIPFESFFCKKTHLGVLFKPTSASIHSLEPEDDANADAPPKSDLLRIVDLDEGVTPIGCRCNVCSKSLEDLKTQHKTWLTYGKKNSKKTYASHVFGFLTDLVKQNQSSSIKTKLFEKKEHYERIADDATCAKWLLKMWFWPAKTGEIYDRKKNKGKKNSPTSLQSKDLRPVYASHHYLFQLELAIQFARRNQISSKKLVKMSQSLPPPSNATSADAINHVFLTAGEKYSACVNEYFKPSQKIPRNRHFPTNFKKRKKCSETCNLKKIKKHARRAFSKDDPRSDANASRKKTLKNLNTSEEVLEYLLISLDDLRSFACSDNALKPIIAIALKDRCKTRRRNKKTPKNHWDEKRDLFCQNASADFCNILKKILCSMLLIRKIKPDLDGSAFRSETEKKSLQILGDLLTGGKVCNYVSQLVLCVMKDLCSEIVDFYKRLEENWVFVSSSSSSKTKEFSCFFWDFAHLISAFVELAFPKYFSKKLLDLQITSQELMCSCCCGITLANRARHKPKKEESNLGFSIGLEPRHFDDKSARDENFQNTFEGGDLQRNSNWRRAKIPKTAANQSPNASLSLQNDESLENRNVFSKCLDRLYDMSINFKYGVKCSCRFEYEMESDHPAMPSMSMRCPLVAFEAERLEELTSFCLRRRGPEEIISDVLLEFSENFLK